MILLDVAGMRALDARQVAERGETPLMRDAGAAIAALVPRYARSRRIVGVAGYGNNGGDAFAALAVLPRAYERIVYALDAPRESAARADAALRAREAGVEIRRFERASELRDLADAGLLLDGIVGVGSHLPLAAPLDGIAEALNVSGAPVLAIDLPSGIDATTGERAPRAVEATATVTIGAVKLGLLLDPAREIVGDLWLAPIGFPQTHDGVVAHALDDAEMRALVPERPQNTEKRGAGAPLILAGSEQFPGAAVLSALAAARTGAGYVTVAAPKRAARALRAHLVEQVVVTYDPSSVEDAVETIVDLTNHCSSLGIGPGLALSAEMGTIMREVIRRVDLPMVIDATGLFHLAKNLDVLYRKRAVVTPHAGEFARLSGKGTLKEEERISRLRAFVDERHVITLLKGRATLVYDGLALHVNTSGTSALATAGTGDVLTGMIATLLSQGLSPVDAARAAAYWHGVAGQIAAKRRPIGVIATDVIDALAEAFRFRCERIDAPELMRVA